MKKLYVLVACEESQTSCIAFRNLGCIAFSCDLQPCTGGHPEWHIHGDVSPLISNSPCTITCQDGSTHFVPKWDLLLAHPPCTYLSCAYSRKLSDARIKLLKEAASFFMSLYNSSIEYVCVENPRPFRLAALPHPTCVVSPHMFGSRYSKRTYLWTRNLPPVIPTCFNPHPISFTATRSGSKARSKSDPLMYKEIARQFVEFILNDY